MTESQPDANRSNLLIAPDTEVPFQQETFREFEAGNAHSFILYFNVHDYVFTESLAGRDGYKATRLRDYLGVLLQSRGFDVVMYYSLTGGLSFLDAKMHRLLKEGVPEKVRHAARQYGQTSQDDTIRPLAESQVALSYLYRVLTCKPTQTDQSGEGQPGEGVRIAVILEYLETIAPHEDSIQRGPETSFNVQMLHRLALDQRLRQRHMIIGLASDLGHVASSLYAAGSECRAYRVNLPIEEVQAPRPGDRIRRQRGDWLQWVINCTLPATRLENPLDLPGSIGNVEELASQTSGFSYDNLRDLVYYAAKGREPLTTQMVHRWKREVIAAESRDLLEIVEPKHGFDVVAGYDYVTDYLTTIKRAIEQQASDPTMAAIVPKGILMLGPPGTGKSFITASLAKETGFNMVKFKNIRSMWVGETERNLNRVLDLIGAMHPVIVFVDEVDAALGQRGGGAGGDGAGVERRVFQRILEFMALDENRGRVLWIAASNRPDLIDAALISRFDLVIPFLLPDDDARHAMLVDSFPRKIGYILVEEPEARLEECVEATRGFSGRELDTICRRALQLSGEERLRSGPQPTSEAETLPVVTVDYVWSALKDFRQARDPVMYELQTMLALQATNFRAFLPPPGQLPPEISSDEGDDIDVDKLSRYIFELWNRVRGTGRR